MTIIYCQVSDAGQYGGNADAGACRKLQFIQCPLASNFGCEPRQNNQGIEAIEKYKGGQLETSVHSHLPHRLERLSVLDQLFRYRTAAPDGEAWFKITRGNNPVLISAPHACMHVRDGVSKMQEEYTGAIALYLAELCDCHAIFTRYKAFEDPNWQSNSDYKQAIEALVSDCDIKFCIDLHGMRNIYHMGVALGTINGTGWRKRLVQYGCRSSEVYRWCG